MLAPIMLHTVFLLHHPAAGGGGYLERYPFRGTGGGVSSSSRQLELYAE